VRADDRRSGRISARHLYDLGHRRIAHISGPNVSTAQERREGFLEELARLEVSVPEEYVAASDFSFGGGYSAMKKLLALPKRPTAIFCANDPNAMGAVRAARDGGLVVPLDVSVMGAGRFEGDQLPAPFLTSTDWSRRDMGEQAGRMLLELISKGAVSGPVERVMEPRLIIRQSTGPPPDVVR